MHLVMNIMELTISGYMYIQACTCMKSPQLELLSTHCSNYVDHEILI